MRHLILGLGLLLSGCGVKSTGKDMGPKAPVCVVEQYSNGGLERCGLRAQVQFHGGIIVDASVVDVCKAGYGISGGALLYIFDSGPVVRINGGALESIPPGNYQTLDAHACAYTVHANGSITL